MSSATGLGSFQLRRYAAPLLIFLLSFVLQVASLPRIVGNIYDEGFIVAGAQRILDGDIPYRDFWTLYAPGQFYAVAGLFKLFDSSILIEQLWDVAIRAGVVAVAFAWARRLHAGAYAYAAALTVLLILAGAGFHGFPTVPALLFGLISGYLVLAGCSGTRPLTYLFTAGLFVGLATLFRHDIGFYFFAAEALALVLQPPTSVSGARGSLRCSLRRIAPLALGAVVAVAPVAAWLLIRVPAGDLWFSLFWFPVTSYPATRALPFPALPNPFGLASGSQSLAQFCESFLIYFPMAVGVAGVLVVWRRSRDLASAAEALWRLGILLLGLVTLFAYLKGIVRVSSLHLLQSIVPATILVFVLSARASRLTLLTGLAVPVLAVGFAFAAAAMHAQIAYRAARETWLEMRPYMPEAPRGLRSALTHLCAPQPGLERARCFRPRTEDAAVIEFVQQHTGPNQRIYVGADRHDRIFVNNVMLYFLAAREPATKWNQFDPDIQTTAVVQSQIIDELTAGRVRFLVLSSEWSNVTEPNASAISSGIMLLDNYIRENFTQVREFGRASVWERKRRSQEG